jgi:hypothetical protein
MLFALSVFTRKHLDLGHKKRRRVGRGEGDETRAKTSQEESATRTKGHQEKPKYFASPYCPSFLEDWTAAVFFSQSTAATAAAPGGIAGRLYRRGRGRKRRQKAEEGNN